MNTGKIGGVLAAIVLVTASGFGQVTLNTNAFNLWENCQPAPVTTNANGGGFIVPVGNLCSPDDAAAQENECQDSVGMQFYGALIGGTNAPNAGDQEAVFITDDVTTWVGHEMGFIKTLQNNALQYYIQGGGNFIYGTVSLGDNGYHTFMCQCRSSTQTNVVDFYLDGAYLNSLTNPGSSYYGNCCYMVGTTHRVETNGVTWNSTGQQIQMYDMEIFTQTQGTAGSITNFIIQQGSASFTIHGSGGTVGSLYHVLSTGNLLLPFSDWTVAATNYFDGRGNFSFTNAINPAMPAQFYDISVP